MTSDDVSRTNEYFAVLRRKWATVPFTQIDRIATDGLSALDDEQLLSHWEKARRITVDGRDPNNRRGWYQLLYRDWCRGRKIIDMGCGLGIDGLHFAEHGAKVTFVDLVPSNIEVVQRICRLKGIADNCTFLVMETLGDLDGLPADYDAVFGFGSLMHAPLEIMKPEFAALVARLKPEGRFIMHAYPKSRWEREGEMPFEKWGEKTDGQGTPWAEWYDANKLIEALKPARFHLVYYCDWYRGDMNCIDLVQSAAAEDDIQTMARRLVTGPDLAKAVTYPYWKDASLSQGVDGLSVLTPTPCWAYAVEVPLQSHAHDIPAGARVFLRVKARVSQGEIGVGLLSADGRDFLTELRFSTETDTDVLFAEVDGFATAQTVIIRNACRDGEASEAVIEDVGCYWV
jgi:2-polyprenyl-3-methyl-5-hydroxy-6-metoxy-1,4-benzoquinol methylase